LSVVWNLGFVSKPPTHRKISHCRQTLLRVHQALVKRKYRLLFTPKRRCKPGPKGPSRELIEAIIEMKKRNPRFGCPRIAQQINLAFGTNINKDIVRRVLAAHFPFGDDGGKGNGPSWLTFFGQAKDSLWSIDLFRCESVTLRTHWVLLVMDQFTRRIVGFAVHQGSVDSMVLCRMFNSIVSDKPSPVYLSRDNDPLFRLQQWQANLRMLEIQEIKSVPCVAISHPFVERLIGSVRREFLSQTLFWNENDLTKKLASFQAYYNERRAHSSLEGKTPVDFREEKPKLQLGCQNYGWESHCRGLFQLPISV
jgi:transposase InsO family protein